MAGENNATHDTSDQIVLKAIHDKTGWRVQLHLHSGGDNCTILEGHARFPDEQSCHEHGRALHQMIDVVIGIVEEVPDKPGSN